jgi:hypothetical protein
MDPFLFSPCDIRPITGLCETAHFYKKNLAGYIYIYIYSQKDILRNKSPKISGF